MVDLDSLIENKGEQKVKVYLTEEQKKVGWVELNSKFTQMPTEEITFMF